METKQEVKDCGSDNECCISKQEVKHTPKYEWHESNTGNHQGLIVDAAGNNIAVTYEKANAAFIVKACNSYESDQKKIKALLKELKEAHAAEVLAYGTEKHSETCHRCQAIQQARAVKKPKYCDEHEETPCPANCSRDQ